MKNLSSLIVLPLLTFLIVSCKDDEQVDMPDTTPPELSVEIKDLSRTNTTFTISSVDAADYAYMILGKDDNTPESAQYIFENGKSGLLEDGIAEVSTIDIEGGKEFKIYTAVRKINPYVYSGIDSVLIDTTLPYNNIVTLNKIGLTDFTYHVEVPEGVSKVKHVIVKKADYIAIKGILAAFGDVSYEGYLKVFGHTVTESTDVTLDKYSENGSGNGIHIYSGSTYLMMGGVIGEDGEIDNDRFECVEFDTRKAEVSPYNINVSIETTSNSATVNIVPDPEIVSYRVLIEARSEYDFFRREGESQVRSLIIGFWDDSTNRPKREYQGTAKITNPALIPNTEYVVGIIGFDSKNREKVITIDFVTAMPTGTKPTIKISKATANNGSSWNSAAYNVKVTNANEVRYGFFTKEAVDRVLSNGSTISGVIMNNGTLASNIDVAAMLKPDGLLFETEGLLPSTEYIFGVYAVNPEYVSQCEYVTFTTDDMPQTGGDVRKNMPGKYIATTTNQSGETITFPVTISAGVDNATTADYKSRNRLVATGFGPEQQFPVKYPSDLIQSGYSTEDASLLYGPKWFIEFTDNGICVPSSQSNMSFSWSMGNFGEQLNAYMWGIGIRSNGRDQDTLQSFPVKVSDDGNTITIEGIYQKSGDVTYYPAMVTALSPMFYKSCLFRCYSNIVLTRVK